MLEWVAICFCRGHFWPREETWDSRIACTSFTIWATKEPLMTTPLLGPSMLLPHDSMPVTFRFLSPRKDRSSYSRGKFQLTVGPWQPRSEKGKVCWQADFSAWVWGCLGRYTTDWPSCFSGEEFSQRPGQEHRVGLGADLYLEWGAPILAQDNLPDVGHNLCPFPFQGQRWLWAWSFLKRQRSHRQSF